MMMNAIQNASGAFFPNKARTAPTISRALYIIALSLSLWLICITQAEALILTVRQDGGGQYSTIQSAINNAQNGDTVLVFPGRYYENVDFIGKSITVCSREATTNDSTYISRTIIDGNNSGSCVVFRNQEQNAVLRGLTLEHGSGIMWTNDLTAGGGVCVRNYSDVSIINSVIRYNRASEGAGLFCSKSSMNLSGIRIHDNISFSVGSGLYIYSHPSFTPEIVFDPVNRCSIYNNYGVAPCDIQVVDVPDSIDIYLDMGSVLEPSNFYIGRHNNFQSTQGFQDIVHVNRGYRVEANQDIYVSPDGNDCNSGFSPGEAMRSITLAVHKIASDSLNPKTVHVLPGIYREGDHDQILPIPGKSYVSILGSGSANCSIYTDRVYDNMYQMIYYTNKQTRQVLHGFTLLCPTIPERRLGQLGIMFSSGEISDIVIEDTSLDKFGVAYVYGDDYVVLRSIQVRNITTTSRVIYGDRFTGSMIDCTFENVRSSLTSDDGWAETLFDMWIGDSLRVENCVFRNFSVPDIQPTIHFSCNESPNPTRKVSISNCLFDNLRTGAGYAIGFHQKDTNPYYVTNNTFINNDASLSAIGLSGSVWMRNNVFYDPDAEHELYLPETAPWGYRTRLYMDNNDLRGGQSSIHNPYSNNLVFYSETNTDADPAFVSLDPENRDYAHLSRFSPCIDTGTADITGLGLPPYDLDGRYRVWNGRIDMGCYEYGSEPYVGNDDPVVVPPPTAFGLCNYPNPFNPTTTIRFELPRDAPVNLCIYNLKGQRVKELVDTTLRIGQHQALWDGTDSRGRHVASGVYYCRLTAGKDSETRKMMLIK